MSEGYGWCPRRGVTAEGGLEETDRLPATSPARLGILMPQMPGTGSPRHPWAATEAVHALSRFPRQVGHRPSLGGSSRARVDGQIP